MKQPNNFNEFLLKLGHKPLDEIIPKKETQIDRLKKIELELGITNKQEAKNDR